MNVKFRENFYYRTTPPAEKDEYWTGGVYKVNGERLKKRKIDLFKVVEQFDPDYIPTPVQSIQGMDVSWFLGITQFAVPKITVRK